MLGMLKDYDAEKNPNLTMWATHYAYMNDPTEFEFGIEVCLPFIKEIEEEDGVPEDEKIYPILSETEDLSQHWGVLGAQHFELRGVVSPYIISFSQARDSLHMWNMYGQNGNGLALCFDIDRVRRNRTYYIFDTCIYMPKVSSSIDKRIRVQLKERVRICYMDILKKYRSLVTCMATKEDDRMLRTALFATFLFAEVASFVKNRAYADECEYRMLADGACEPLFRERNGEIIPYMESQVPFKALTNIIVGPTRDFERTRNSILLLLGQKGISWSPDKIIKSNVPYRG